MADDRSFDRVNTTVRLNGTVAPDRIKAASERFLKRVTANRNAANTRKENLKCHT